MVTTLDGRRKDYYEATLQMRDVSPEFVDAVISEIEESGKCAISKIKPFENGVDLFMSDQHYTQSLGKLLKARHGGEITLTKKLFGRWSKTGHIVYRVTVLYRKLPFKIGDVIETDDGPVKVLSMKKTVQVQNLNSRKKEYVRPEQLERFCR
jgi:NMD protein affecting ribosome stability and mRNA decay